MNLAPSDAPMALTSASATGSEQATRFCSPNAFFKGRCQVGLKKMYVVNIVLAGGCGLRMILVPE